MADYDADGNVNMQIDSQYAQDSDGMKIEAVYNEHGAITSGVIYDANGSVISTETWEYTYGDNGFKTTEKEYLDGSLYQEIIYKIVTEDDSMFGYAETVTTYKEDGSKTVCVYDENNELVSETTYDASGNVIE